MTEFHLSPAGAASVERLFQSFDQEENRRLEIMERVKARVLWTDRDKQVKSAFADILLELAMRVDPDKPFGPGNRREARSLGVLGKTGAGKSSLLSRLFAGHPAFPGYNVPNSGCALITVNVPSPCNLKALGIILLAQLGYPLQQERSVPLIWQLVTERLRHLGILVLHLDEVHNVLQAANTREIVEIRKTFKTLMIDPAWPVALVVSGLPEVKGFFEKLDEEEIRPEGQQPDTRGEVRRRFRFVELPSLRLPHDARMMAAAVKDLASIAGLEAPADLASDIVPRLIHAGLYELGICMELTHDAITKALQAKAASLVIKHYADAWRTRTGSADRANPFLAIKWLKVDCSVVLAKKREGDR
ncbi:TniB family NTP-binding protein [Microvirga mediterraneensis]|uniref:TniB family NTP-binding protein n=1 Tax=Microvirga mediterraneensis TaxID=2754695 RepID=A0A838BNR5_9HYPH|nr:TniB family NTP-binding protein [Microvirga mediterraneensis]MBA1157040.1 TniB family NTP-binding protein [Microvirga mediterraneensis]